MEIHDFAARVQEERIKRPGIFGLDADCRASVEDIGMIEAYYGVQLPLSYKEFLMQFGGGYFAFVVVYSLDANSDFYLKKNVDPEFTKANNFLPVVDFETGDLAGFRILELLMVCVKSKCLFLITMKKGLRILARISLKC